MDNEFQPFINIIASKQQELRKAASAARRAQLRAKRDLVIVKRAGRIIQNPNREPRARADLHTLASARRIVKKTIL